MAASLYMKKRYPPAPLPGAVPGALPQQQEPEISGSMPAGYIFVRDLPGGRLCRCLDGGAWVYLRNHRG